MTAEGAAVITRPSSLHHLNVRAANTRRAVPIPQATSVIPSQEVRARKPTSNRTSGGDRKSPHAK
jgi:hypothetical protein